MTAFLSKLRFLVLVMLGAYLALNALLLLFAPITQGWPLYAATAITVPPMVLAMVYIVIPLARRGQT